MPLPQLMFKIWDGDRMERFTFRDMNRIIYNAGILADALDIAKPTFTDYSRVHQLLYTECNALEQWIGQIADEIEVAHDTMRLDWSHGQDVSYVDFDRWELVLFDTYRAMGGVGERIPADTRLYTYNAILFRNSWQGHGPYTYDIILPPLHLGREAFAFVSHTATVAQRMAEYNGLFKAKYVADRVMRIYAYGLKPNIDVPIKVTMGVPGMNETITVDTDWVGSGPWTHDIELQSEASDAVIGACESMTATQYEAFARAGISVSAIDGDMLTLRAMFTKPTIAIPVGVLYNVSEVV